MRQIYVKPYDIDYAFDCIRIIKIYINICNLIKVRNKVALLSHT